MLQPLIDNTRRMGGRIANHIKDPAKRRSWMFRLRVLSLLPPLTGFAILFLLAGVPQLREVYLGIIEESDFVRGGIGFGLLVLLCALLYVWHFSVGTGAINTVYPEHADVHLDHELMIWRDGKALICAALPFIGIILGLIGLSGEASKASLLFGEILSDFKPRVGDTLAVEFHSTRTELILVPLYISVAIAIMFGVLELMRRYLSHDALGHLLRVGVMRISLFLTGCVIALPLIAPSLVVPVARLAGPLAGINLVLLAFVTVLASGSWVIKRIDPALLKGAAVVLAVCLAGYVLYLNFGGGGVKRRNVEEAGVALAGDQVAQAAVREWLKTRQDRGAYADRPYPVFVVAAQGGGIYATSAATSFLASLQDGCENFAQHVFAISGVSGGAVGTALFAGLAGVMPQSRETCGERGLRALKPEEQVSTRRVEAMVLDDHLSPVVGLIAPDLVRKAVNWAWPIRGRFDRSNAIERSMACSFDQFRNLRPDAGYGRGSWGWPTACGESSEPNGTGLRADYAAFWRPTGAAPAPILNSTWAEVGYRVAFSPFPLRAIGDGTLYAFTELPINKDDLQHSLVEAAFVSARFPGIVPARRIEPRVEGALGPLAWNFVDGGYVDNSGASTALDIYKLVETVAKDDNANIDLRLVLLTNAETSLDYAELKGSRWDDTVAPIEALLNVRGQLSQRAITQAIEYVTKQKGRGRKGLIATQADDPNVLVVDLEQQTFKLPLGWKISNVTNDIVRLMMGRPDLCPQVERGAPPVSEVSTIIGVIEHNSCVKYRMARLLQGK